MFLPLEKRFQLQLTFLRDSYLEYELRFCISLCFARACAWLGLAWFGLAWLGLDWIGLN